MTQPATQATTVQHDSAVETCPSCGATISAEFCAQCGERRPSARAHSLREFLHEAFEAATNIDRSFLKSLWTLLRRPGELTAAYMRGQRMSYLRPLQLFLLINVFFFFVAGSSVTVFSTPLRNQITTTPYRDFARSVVRERWPASGKTLEEYGTAFNEKSLLLARTLVIVIVPAFALVVALISVRRRRPAVQHVVFSVHYLSFGVLWIVAIIYFFKAIIPLMRAIGLTSAAVDQLAGLLVAVGTLAYLTPAYRRVYGDGRVSAVVKAALSFAGLTLILVWYRFLLFIITAYTL